MHGNNGMTKHQVAEEYRKEYNKKQKQKRIKDRERAISSMEALAYVEPIIYAYQMKILRGEKA